MNVPNPKTAAELLALPEWQDEIQLTIITEEMRDRYQPFVGYKLKVGHTIRLPNPQIFEPNPCDPDTVILARDADGITWVQRGSFKVRAYL